MIRSKPLPKRPIQHAVVLVGFKKSRRSLESKCVGTKARFHVGEFGKGLCDCFLQLPDIKRSGFLGQTCSGHTTECTSDLQLPPPPLTPLTRVRL
jgi:hypothetical protein